MASLALTGASAHSLQSEYSLWWREPEAELLPTCEELDIGNVATKQIISAIKSVKPDGDSDITTGETSLGVTDPERFRSKLLALIKESVAQTKAALDASSVEITGLGAPVQAVQKNDDEVTLFLGYYLTMTQ